MAKPRLFGGTNPAGVASANAVAVIGLGRFGRAVALELSEAGTDVLGVDAAERTVQTLNGQLAQVVTADATQEAVLRQLAVPDFDRVVVAIGSDIQASILVASLLVRFNIPNVWAKAISEQHGTILEQLGVHHVIYPEKDMGRRVAHLVRGSMQDYIEIDEDLSLVKTTPHADLVGRTLSDSRIHTRYGVTVIAVKHIGGPWTPVTPTSVLHPDDTLLVAGAAHKTEHFSQLHAR